MPYDLDIIADEHGSRARPHCLMTQTAKMHSLHNGHFTICQIYHTKMRRGLQRYCKAIVQVIQRAAWNQKGRSDLLNFKNIRVLYCR